LVYEEVAPTYCGHSRAADNVPFNCSLHPSHTVTIANATTFLCDTHR